MKLMWFHLMPYTELPPDFKEKHPSVWVDIHSSLFDPKRAHLMYNDFMDELEYAADCGYDAICVNEHHSNGYGLMPSPNLIAASLARRTTRSSTPWYANLLSFCFALLAPAALNCGLTNPFAFCVRRRSTATGAQVGLSVPLL